MTTSEHEGSWMTRHYKALAVACGECGATNGNPCYDLNGGVHRSRHEKWKKFEAIRRDWLARP